MQESDQVQSSRLKLAELTVFGQLGNRGPTVLCTANVSKEKSKALIVSNILCGVPKISNTFVNWSR